MLTPIDSTGDVMVKRDDAYEYAGHRGGKVRTCRAIVRRAIAAGDPGVVTAGARHSPQVAMVAAVAATEGIGARCHVPAGAMTPELEQAAADGAELVTHRPGYNSLITSRARLDSVTTGWRLVPFGMECTEAVVQTASQVDPDQFAGAHRLVISIGSGMSLAGILHGMARHHIDIPVLGVVVGADPRKRLDRWAPATWTETVDLVAATVPYTTAIAGATLGTIPLDPIYEAKTLPFLRPHDLLWIVGRRADPNPKETP